MSEQEQTDHPNIQNGSDIVQLMILSAGAYGLIWFWKAWTEVKAGLKLEVSPGWRAFFSNFTIHTLARDINWLAVEAKGKPSLKPYVILAAVWLSSLIGVLANEKKDLFILISLIVTVAIETFVLVIMQRKLNEYFLNGKPAVTEPKNMYIYTVTITVAILSWIGILASIYGAVTGSNPLNK